MNIILCDDHPLIRRSLRELLQEIRPDAALREATSAAELFQLQREQPAQMVVLDLSLPDRHGLECLSELRQRDPALKVLILSMHNEERFALRALELGASGYLGKHRAPAEIAGALQRVLNGGRYIDPETAEALARRAFGGSKLPHEALSPREFSVLRELGRGSSPATIAEQLFLSAKTVSTYRSRVLSKLGLKTNADLVRYCLSHALIE